MKILTLCYEYPPVGGGGGRMAHQMSAGLVGLGHEVRVQTVRVGDLPHYECRDGVGVFRTFGFRRRPDRCSVPEMGGFLATSFFPTLRHIREWKPDVIHAHFAVPTGALALACRMLTGTPYMLTAHLGDLPGGNPDQTDSLFRVLNPAIRPIWNRAAAVSASSSFAAGLARRAYQIEPEIILNGVPMDGIAPVPRPAHDPPALVAIGRFHPQKNFPWLVRALVGCDFPWRLTLIGDGDQRGEIEREIVRSGLGDRIQMLGWVTEQAMRNVLLASDILLMPSTSEGNPVAAIEALKQGLAILGSDIRGLSDILREGENGFAVSLAGPEAFCERLATLCANPMLLQKMKFRSLEIATDFDLTKIVQQFERCLLDAARPGVKSDV